MGRIYIDTDELHSLARDLRADAGALGDINRDLVGNWARTHAPPVELVGLAARSAWVQGKIAITGGQLHAEGAGLDVEAWATDAEEGVGDIVGGLLGGAGWRLREGLTQWPSFALKATSWLLDKVHRAQDARRSRLLLLGLGEATIGRLSHLVTRTWPTVFWRGTGRIGGLMSKKALNRFPLVSVALDTLEAAVAYQKAGGATGTDFWRHVVSGSGTTAAFGVGAGLAGVVGAASAMAAGSAAAMAFGGGMLIGDGINQGSRILTGESVSDRWSDWAIGGKLDQIDKKGEQLAAINHSMSSAEIRRRSEELGKLSAQAHETAERTKNPWNVALMMVGIGR